MAQQQSNTELSEIIAENFGANATYVEALLARFRSDPALVDESWRAYFAELFGDGALSESPTAGTVTQPQADGGGTTVTSPHDGNKAVAAK
ncbi:MAG TPA: hypothetical protein VHD88_07865, partial [Pyrinomonadaceae bacterium]|nr:hypothetical protein [Pyrinomonadaceae bacterium]